MTYTIEELEALLGDFGTRLEAAQARIVELETFDSPVTLLEHAQMKARIEAAAAIAERDRDSARWNGSSIVKAEATAWNAARAEFRKALELE